MIAMADVSAPCGSHAGCGTAAIASPMPGHRGTSAGCHGVQGVWKSGKMDEWGPWRWAASVSGMMRMSVCSSLRASPRVPGTRFEGYGEACEDAVRILTVRDKS
ncbi:hypothetical protein WDZ92_44330, partial [Nostoc sp. NIES-2111]